MQLHCAFSGGECTMAPSSWPNAVTTRLGFGQLMDIPFLGFPLSRHRHWHLILLAGSWRSAMGLMRLRYGASPDGSRSSCPNIELRVPQPDGLWPVLTASTLLSLGRKVSMCSRLPAEVR